MSGGNLNHVTDTQLNLDAAAGVMTRWTFMDGIAKCRTIPNGNHQVVVLATEHHEPRGVEVYLALGGTPRDLLKRLGRFLLQTRPFQLPREAQFYVRYEHE